MSDVPAGCPWNIDNMKIWTPNQFNSVVRKTYTEIYTEKTPDAFD